jgi:NAD+-dependent secondary alcohol dehydrogenase Adh1
MKAARPHRYHEESGVQLPYVPGHENLDELMTLAAQKRVSLHTSVYPLEAIDDAMADLDNGRPQGRGILVPSGAV